MCEGYVFFHFGTFGNSRITDLSFSFLGLSRLELLLHVLDESEGRVQVGRGRRDLAGLLRVGAAVCTESRQGRQHLIILY